MIPMDFLLHHLLRRSAERFPDKEALVHGGIRVTYQEFFQNVLGLAQGLRNANLSRGERVAVYLDAGLAEATAIFGISQSDGVIVPINPQLLPPQVAHICNDTDPHEESGRLFLHYGDMTDSSNLIHIVEQVQPDEIYNLAAQSNVKVSFEAPEYTANTNAWAPSVSWKLCAF